MMHGRLLAVSAVLLLSSCGSPTEPAVLPASVQAVRIYSNPPYPAVTASPGTLQLAGGILLNEPCYEFSVTATLQDTLVVTVIAQRRTGICQQVLAAFSYTIVVTEVVAGTYPVRLVHDQRGPPSFAETVLEQTVIVP